MTSRAPLSLLVAAVTAVLTVAGCDSGTESAQSSSTSEKDAAADCRTLAENPGWYGDNRDRIDTMLAELGTCGADGSVADGAPVALFDWDNTLVKNDIGDATFFWMVRNGKLRAPAGGDWSTTSPYLTPQAVGALSKACAAAKPGQPMPTDTDLGCADELL